MSKHLYLNFPININNPPIAKKVKKNIIITPVQKISGNAESKAFMRIFKASIAEIVLKGLKTLKVRKIFKSTFNFGKSLGKCPVTTTIKSKTFH